MTHGQVSDLTAIGAGGVKTNIGNIQLPKNTGAKIVGIWSQAYGYAAMTTVLPVTGILELESKDMNIIPMQLPLDSVDVLTSGAVAMAPRIIPVDVPFNGGETITGYITVDVTQTGALKGRWGLLFE